MKESMCKDIASKYFIFISKSRRGVAPVIATLLLVAIAVVGGSTVFVFAQDSFSTSQISGTSQVEYLKIVGYDLRDAEKLFLHDGTEILAKNCCGFADGVKNSDERIAIYLQNNSVKTVTISELRFAGDDYSFVPTSKIGDNTKIGNGHKPKLGEYIIVNQYDQGTKYLTVDESAAIIQPGETVTLLLDLKHKLNMFGDSQIKITTTNGNVVVSSLQTGQSLL